MIVPAIFIVREYICIYTGTHFGMYVYRSSILARRPWGLRRVLIRYASISRSLFTDCRSLFTDSRSLLIQSRSLFSILANCPLVVRRVGLRYASISRSYQQVSFYRQQVSFNVEQGSFGTEVRLILGVCGVYQSGMLLLAGLFLPVVGLF